ncbi:MAG: hypothetical protein LBS94_01095 [Prevotellaceae bacterium]|jgi:hypothetical protein|nr:hypothetical protein [Prevotellaceae bacterium]
MKKILKFGAVLSTTLIMVGCASTQKIADKETQQFRYEIEAAGVGTQGTYQVKVWTYSKDPNVATEQAKKNAVHGVIFKGFAGKDRVTGQKPLAANAGIEQERKDYFEPFFANGGKYQQFVSLSNNGAIAPGDRIKIGKEYKIGVVVSVNVATLRKELEDAGIIQKLGGIF